MYKIELRRIIGEGKVGIIDNLSGIKVLRLSSQLSSYTLHQKSGFFEQSISVSIHRLKLELQIGLAELFFPILSKF